jgi:DNA-binding MarR family transcriptional regulator
MVKGELNRLLGRMSRLHTQVSYTEFTKKGITQGQPRILRYLEAHEGCIQREICENCHMKPATVTEVLEKMEGKRLIERKNEPGSRRNLQVFLTPLGREYLKNAEQVDQLMEELCFQGFTSEEKEQAARCFERISGNLVKADELLQNEAKDSENAEQSHAAQGQDLERKIH